MTLVGPPTAPRVNNEPTRKTAPTPGIDGFMAALRDLLAATPKVPAAPIPTPVTKLPGSGNDSDAARATADGATNKSGVVAPDTDAPPPLIPVPAPLVLIKPIANAVAPDEAATADAQASGTVAEQDKKAQPGDASRAAAAPAAGAAASPEASALFAMVASQLIAVPTAAAGSALPANVATQQPAARGALSEAVARALDAPSMQLARAQPAIAPLRGLELHDDLGSNGDTQHPASTAPDVTANEFVPIVAPLVKQVTVAAPSGSNAAQAATPAHGRHPATAARQDSSDAHDAPAASVAAGDNGAAIPANLSSPLAARLDAPLPDLGDGGPRTLPDLPAPRGAAAHATLELDAEKTGASRIRIAVQGSQVRATITASEFGAANLDRQLPELRRSLEDRGFSDIRLSVRTQEHAGAAAAGSSRSTDDAPSFNRDRQDSQEQRPLQRQDTGDRAGQQRRRRDQEEDQV